MIVCSQSCCIKSLSSIYLTTWVNPSIISQSKVTIFCDDKWDSIHQGKGTVNFQLNAKRPFYLQATTAGYSMKALFWGLLGLIYLAYAEVISNFEQTIYYHVQPPGLYRGLHFLQGYIGGCTTSPCYTALGNLPRLLRPRFCR